MSTVGMGIGASVGVALESVEGVYEAPDVSLTFTQESMKAQRPTVESGSITGDRSVDELLDGVKSGAGDLDQEVDCVNNQLLLYCVNGKATGALATSVLPGRVSTGVTATPGAGGTLAAGAYKYKVATVWERTATAGKELFICPASSEATGTTASSNLTNAVAWTNPADAPPEGWTVKGHLVYRTVKDGASNSQKNLAYVAMPGNSYSDTGSATLGSKVPVVPVAPVQENVLTKAFTLGQNPLPAFSLTINKDNDKAVAFTLCRANSWEINVSGGGSVVTNKFSILARDWEVVDNFVPSISSHRKAMGWGVTAAADGTQSERFQGFSCKIDNGGAPKEGLSGLPRMSDINYGKRKVTGTLPRDYQNQDYVKKLRDAGRFSLDVWIIGGPIVSTDSAIEISAGVIARPLPYMMRIEVPRAALSDAGANASGSGQMIEQLTWMAQTDEVEATDIRITIYNLTDLESQVS